ncbi:MAG: DUF2344 domain-containing protein [Clostridia bacterium]|nr:DUF2344 domain-containing protein [Clostridia bacterium]
MTKYRLKYCKESGMRFISHLDLLKLFSRAARRCRLPLSYSHGFNPHPELVFNAPLPLGVTSEAEYVDLSLDEELLEGECFSLLASSLPEGIRPLSVRKLAPGEATVMKYVCACQYRLLVKVQGTTPDEFVTAIQTKLSKNEPILIMKKSKSGVKETDIRPLIRAFFEDLEIEQERLGFSCVTAAGNVMNLRPEVALAGLSQHVFGDAVQVDVEEIHKVRYYTEDGGSPD